MMRLTKTLPVLAVVLIYLLPAALVADDSAHNVRAVRQHILPAYQALAGATRAMHTQAVDLCQNPTQASLLQTREKFQQSMDAWQAIQHIRFGPIEFALRMNRIQLWPDKRNSVGKHLNRLMTARDIAALESGHFANVSVAVQGFSALERLLFGAPISAASFTADKPESHFRCAVVMAITNNLATISAHLHKEWSQGDEAYVNYIAGAAQGNDFYENEREVSSIMLNNLHAALQVIVEQKLDRPLDRSLNKARGTRAENWRSGRSLRNIRINLASLESFYRIAFAPRLNNETLNRQIGMAFADTLQALGSIPLPLDQAVKDSASRPQVETLRAQANHLKTLIGTELTKSLGLPLGFNSLDGD